MVLNLPRRSFPSFSDLLKRFKPLKSLLIVHGFSKSNLLLGQFLKSCFNLGAPNLALSAFYKIQNPNLLFQNLMLKGLSNHGLYEDLLSVYLKCRVLNCPSDDFTFPFVIKACSALGAFGIGKQIHCIVLRKGYERNVVIMTSLIGFYAKNAAPSIARKLIDGISEPDLVAWNALLSGYCFNGLDKEALGVFMEIQGMYIKPNVSTLASIIPVCTRLEYSALGRSLHGFAVKCGYFLDDFLVPAFISMYKSEVDLSSARKLFDFAVDRNVCVWNAMIHGYMRNERFFEGFEMFREMLRADVRPNSVTFVCTIPSCENNFNIWYGGSLHGCGIKHGLGNQVSVLTALVSMYAKLGEINLAEFLFNQMPNKKLLSWNVMISGYVNNGLWIESLVAFQEMHLEGFSPDAVSIVSILSACSNLGGILLGKSAHAFVVRRSFETNINVSNALLGFYSDCCLLSTCFKLFQKMANKNTVSWNTLISGYVHSGQKEKANMILHQMQKEGEKLDSVSLLSILSSYTESKNFRQGTMLHGYAIKTGCDSDVSLTNALISMCCNCGEIDAGTSLFDVMPERSVVSWNSLMTAFRHYNLSNNVLNLFGQMIKEDQRPNQVSLLNLCPVCHTLSQGQSIHAFALRTGIIEETTLLTSLIFMYARFGKINLCFLLFQMGRRRHISLWNAIMSVHVDTKNAQRAVAFFRELLQICLEPDNITILSLISACILVNSLHLADSVMAYVIHKGFDKDVVVTNALIDLYARCGNIVDARLLFDYLLEKDAISWSVMINGYKLHGDARGAIEIFSRMQLSGVSPDDITYLSLLSACSHAGFVEKGQRVFNYMVENGVSPRTEHYACMVDLLGRTGHLHEAYDIVSRLPYKPSVGMLESLLGSCKIYGDVELGERIFQMLSEMYPQNSESYVMLHNIYAAAGKWGDANRVRSNIERRLLRKHPGFSLLVGD
ncbi:Pentatricopeptide repeat - like 10 [Theobroma cacao]|nr:Pentatricopeptide repeat - like 10 [Theobroma cacao]